MIFFFFSSLHARYFGLELFLWYCAMFATGGVIRVGRTVLFGNSNSFANPLKISLFKLTCLSSLVFGATTSSSLEKKFIIGWILSKQWELQEGEFNFPHWAQPAGVDFLVCQRLEGRRHFLGFFCNNWWVSSLILVLIISDSVAVLCVKIFRNVFASCLVTSVKMFPINRKRGFQWQTWNCMQWWLLHKVNKNSLWTQN